MEELLREAASSRRATSTTPHNATLVHHVNQALRAHTLFQRDKDYIVRNGEVVIIDEFTGRMMPGRRYSEGLHQALEAKEHVQVQPENQTLASITFQNYFRLYKKLAGMTGTAATEADEFQDIYKLEVVEIPTNMPVPRIDEDDEVYRTAEEKYKAIIQEIEKAAAARPADPGRHHLDREVRAARRAAAARHGFKQIDFDDPKALEPLFAAARDGAQRRSTSPSSTPASTSRRPSSSPQAGVPGAITIATNMAGRGTDIQLGGNPDMRIAAGARRPPSRARRRPRRRGRDRGDPSEVGAASRSRAHRPAGGLYIVGTERHESRRIDNQLRGRAGRQGDPGHSKFYLSLQDDLMRIFGSDRMDGMLQSSASRKTRPSSIPGSTRRSRRRSRRSRRATSTSARTSSNTTTS